MDAALQDFLGNKPSMETQKPEPQPADTQEQASGAVQEKADEAVPEQTDETPQVVRRISGKQRRASLEEYKGAFLPVPSDWWRTSPGSTLPPTGRTSRHGVNSEN